MTRPVRNVRRGCLSALVGMLAWRGSASAADIQQVRSPGGIAAWLVQERSLPIVTIRFAFDGGSAQEPMGKEGTAGLLAAMLDQGAGNLSGAAYQKRMENACGAHLLRQRPRLLLRQLRDADGQSRQEPASC